MLVQPFSHVLPKNNTPYFNHTEPAEYDGPGLYDTGVLGQCCSIGECLRHVYSPAFGYEQLHWAVDAKPKNFFMFNQSEFLDDQGVGFTDAGEVYIPSTCVTKPAKQCKLLFMLGRVDADFARYAESNNIVIVGMCLGGSVDQNRFPNAQQIVDGLGDVFGQLSPDYAMQKSPHMRVAGRILRRLIGDQCPPSI